MLTGPNPAIANLSAIYTSNNAAIALALSRIASGKRVQNPSDDFWAYAKASSLQSDIDLYEKVKQGLQEGKGFADYAVQVGDTIVSDMDRLSELKVLWTASGDPVEKAAYKAEYDAVVLRITDTKNDASYDGYPVYATGNLYKTIKTNTNGGTFDINASAIGDETLINDITNPAQDVNAQLQNAATYSAQMKLWGSLLDSFSKLADSAINSNQAGISVLTDIDEAEEMTLLTNLQVRQQATVAMMAQSNMAAKYAEILYSGRS